jgi:hypothetical protein
MPRSRFIAHDDQLQVHLGGRAGQRQGARLPSFRVSVPKRTGAQAIVKVGYFRAGRVPGYLQYIERDGTAGPTARDGTTAAQGYSGYIGREGAGEGGQRAALFTWNGQMVDRDAFVHRSQGDPRAWTIIVSPGNGLDMERYVCECMRQMELDLGKHLDWIAAVHYNTAYDHAHILLRGKDREGRAFRIPRRYLQQDLRRHATHIATRARELGWVQGDQAHARAVAWSAPTLARWMTAHARDGQER